MVLLTDELFERVMNSLEDETVKTQAYVACRTLSQEDCTSICSALETDANYWENVLAQHKEDKPSILKHIRNYVARDHELMRLFNC